MRLRQNLFQIEKKKQKRGDKKERRDGQDPNKGKKDEREAVCYGQLSKIGPYKRLSVGGGWGLGKELQRVKDCSHKTRASVCLCTVKVYMCVFVCLMPLRDQTLSQPTAGRYQSLINTINFFWAGCYSAACVPVGLCVQAHTFTNRSATVVSSIHGLHS